MKFINHADFEATTNFLSGRRFGIFTIEGKLELFSCEKIHSTEANVKSSSSSDCVVTNGCDEFESNELLKEEIIATSTAFSDSKASQSFNCVVARRSRSSTIDQSPPRKHRHRGGSLGDLDEVSTQLLLVNLIEALNEFFPDYDFHSTKPEQFVIQDAATCMRAVNKHLSFVKDLDCLFLHKMWASINDAVDIRKAEIFSYVPDMNDDPFSDGILWSFNFFIFNKERGRICYFTCIAKRNETDESYDEAGPSEEEEEETGNEESCDDDSGDDEKVKDWEGII